MTDRLVGRQADLQSLEELWGKSHGGEPQLAVVWGRRRVGKTFLLAHFARRRRSVFFGATQQSETIELARLADAVRRALGDRLGDLAGPTFSSWEAALRFFAAAAAEEPLLLVLDEVPYLLASTPGFASIVQAVWDHLRPGTKLLLVLTGSAVGVIERLLGPNGPLRGRPSWSRRLEPIDATEVHLFLRRLAPDRLFEAYAACGGYPLHLRAWDPDLTTSENLLHLAATPGALLLQDAESLMAEELSGTAGYARILAAVGRGRTRYSEIASDAGQRVEVPLNVLVRAGFLRRAAPVGAPKAAKPQYEIADPYLAFWFSCLYGYRTEIDAGQGAAVLSRAEPSWRRHLGWVFEELARAHAVRLAVSGRLPSDLVVGRWWTVSGAPCEVDVLGLRGRRTALLGEARLQPRPLGLGAVHELRGKLTRVPEPIDNPLLALWAPRGAEAAVRKAGVQAFTMKDVLT